MEESSHSSKEDLKRYQQLLERWLEQIETAQTTHQSTDEEKKLVLSAQTELLALLSNDIHVEYLRAFEERKRNPQALDKFDIHGSCNQKLEERDKKINDQEEEYQKKVEEMK